jgi:hypothetical protein
MQTAELHLRAIVFSTIFQSRFFLLGPTASLLQQRFGRGIWWVASDLRRALLFKRQLHRYQCLQPEMNSRREGGVEPPQPGL